MDGNLYIALCDDEKYVHERNDKMVKKYFTEKNCEYGMVHFFSAKELLESEEKFNVLLLDINMPDMDGIEAAQRLADQGRQYKIIIITGKPERFKEAFKIGAYRFVTKPVDKDEFNEALDDVTKSLMGYCKVQVRFQKSLCQVFQFDIDYIEACGDYVKIYIDNKIFESDRTLKSWKYELDERLFIDCHKSYIVNLGKVKQVCKNKLVLKNGKEVLVSRRRHSDVIQKFMEYDINRH